MENMKVEVDELSAKLSGGALHILAEGLIEGFKSSGAINHIECSFEDPDDGEQYVILMQKKSGLTQGEKNDRLVEENAELREVLKDLIDCNGILTSDKECVIKAKQLLNK